MIQTKKDLHQYLEADRQRWYNTGVPCLKDKFFYNEKWYIYHYLRHLRYVEFFMNKSACGWGSKLRYYIPFLYHWYKYKKLGFKLRYHIAPNTVGPGIMVYHVGDMIWVGSACKIGANCTLRPGVVFGRKAILPKPEPVIVGDNCEFGVGAKIIGSLTIGNNVSVGANAVVTKDIPSDCIAVGVPAKVLNKNS